MTKESRLKLAELISDNPDLDIKCKVDEDCGDGEHSWTMCAAREPRIALFWTYREETIYLDDDEDSLYGQIGDDIRDDLYGPDYKDDDESIKRKIDELPKTMCILIEVEP